MTKAYPTQALVDNILACYYSSSISERIFGKNWYSQAKDVALALSQAYAIDFDIVCAVIAVLSPRNQWSRNIDDATAIIKRFHGNQRYHDLKICTFPANKEKAIKILETGDIETYLKGLKVNAFYECIRTGGFSAANVCIDGHAVSIALGEKISLKDIDARYFRPQGYSVMLEAYKHACSMINLANNNDSDLFLFPCQLQAITWVAHRRIHLNAYISDSSDSEAIDSKIQRIRKAVVNNNEKAYNA